MSQRALLLAVRDHLRERLDYSDKHCEVTFDGHPLPLQADYFVAVHPGEWQRDGDPDRGLEEVFGVQVTVTIWAGRIPQDKLGPNLLVGPVGKSLDEKLEQIRALLHKDPPPATGAAAYPVLTKANALITSARDGFVEPLLFQSGGHPEPKGPDWFFATSKASTMATSGIAQTLSFGGAKRIQVWTGQS